MDFSNRAPSSQGVANNQPATPAPTKRNRKSGGKWTRIGIVAIGAAVVILLLALIALVSFGGGKSESKYVDNNRLQAVFLNTGQVYFGNIKTLNNKYFVLTNIYYLQTTNNNSNSSSSSSSNAGSNVTLVKLGCELHEPYDQMVINSDQVTFWENLQPGGQVAKAVSTFQQQNPNGQKCADQSSSSSTNSTNAAQNAGSNSSSNNNSSSSNSSGSNQ